MACFALFVVDSMVAKAVSPQFPAFQEPLLVAFPDPSVADLAVAMQAYHEVDHRLAEVGYLADHHPVENFE